MGLGPWLQRHVDQFHRLLQILVVQNAKLRPALGDGDVAPSGAEKRSLDIARDPPVHQKVSQMSDDQGIRRAVHGLQEITAGICGGLTAPSDGNIVLALNQAAWIVPSRYVTEPNVVR
jgi:hypothetical protein